MFTSKLLKAQNKNKIKKIKTQKIKNKKSKKENN